MIVVTLLLSGCAAAQSDTNPVVSHTDTEALTYVSRVLATDPGVVRRGVAWRVDMRDALPNHHYLAGGRRITACDVVVLGAVDDVVKLDGFIAETQEELPRRVDFDDSYAMFKTVAIELDAEKVLAGRAAGATNGRISVLLSVDGSVDFGLLRQGLMRQPRSVFFLSRLSFDGGAGQPRYFIARGGSLIVNVAADGKLSLPLVPDPVDADRLLAGVPTLDALAKAAERPVTLRKVPVAGF